MSSIQKEREIIKDFILYTIVENCSFQDSLIKEHIKKQLVGMLPKKK